MSTESPVIDIIDKKILALLQKDASLTNNELAKKIDLSPSATHERVKKLHSTGIIKRFSAFISAKALEKTLCAFISVLIDEPANGARFLKNISSHQEVMECHHVTGEYSYLLKVRVKNTHQLEHFITQSLKIMYCATRTFTQIVLSSPVDGSTIVD